ncbi:hypothetical protein [Vibrio sp. AND4]|uniref:hypothetical protein n=1 Tax=Vibrio sp. AND4 TaxID=314289 RepID=UPI00015F14E0|nr:hypothetical protein [Vibrio sp. AND4]EDP58203.1 hypothetical protein AND4_16125 [Vibrio sp. AND4]
MNFVKSTLFTSTLLLSLASNAASISTIGTHDNGVFNEMQQIQLKSAGEGSVANSGDIFFIDSNDVQVEDLNKELLQDFNSIVIIGDALKNKELMVKLVGFGIEREVVVITDIHDLSKREITTYSKGDKASDVKVAAVLMDTLTRNQ